jgi:hypothetical protein
MRVKLLIKGDPEPGAMPSQELFEARGDTTTSSGMPACSSISQDFIRVGKGSVCDSRTVAPKHDPRKEARRRARLFTRRQGGVGETRADFAELLHVLMRGIMSRSLFVRGVASVTNDTLSSYPVALGGAKPLEEPPPTAGFAKTYTARGTGSDSRS